MITEYENVYVQKRISTHMNIRNVMHLTHVFRRLNDEPQQKNNHVDFHALELQ